MVSGVRYAMALALSAGLITTACGGDASFSPSPSGTGFSANGAVISGVVSGAGGTSSTRSFSDGFGTLDASSSGVQVSVSGTGITSTADGQGRFTLTGVPGGNVELRITGPNVNATVALNGVSANDRIEITVSVNGNHARVDSEHRSKHGNRGVEANGRIASIDASARTIMVGATRVRIPTAAIIRHGSRMFTFADLKVGDHVQVKGALDGTTLVATEVKVEEDDDDDVDDDPNEAKLSGAVSALSGTCPALTFTVQSTKVTTSASTTFRGVTCAAIANAIVVEVKGTKQTDGSVVASRVSRED